MAIERTIAIIGTDFCGSTLLSHLLWLCEGVAAIGEVHAFLRTGKARYRGCDVCGRDCVLFGKLGLVTPVNLYEKVSERCRDYEVMVLSDKSPTVYERTLQRWSAEPLILFRAPWAHGASEEKRGRRTFEEGVAHWDEVYTRALTDYPNATVVGFEAFLAGLPTSLGVLCAALNLPIPGPIPDDLSDIPWHHVGGSKAGRKLKAIDLSRAIAKPRPVSRDAELLRNQLRGEAII